MSSKVRYDWERFWVDAKRRVEIDPEDFFPDPRSEPTWLRPAVEANSLGELSDEPCLILLGEPGLGKSQAIKDAVDSTSTDALVECVNLAAYPDAGALRSKLIEGDAWRNWTTGGRAFHLFLDSFDEATLAFPAIHKFLLEEFREVQSSIDTLHLRLACRSAEWIDEFADGLGELWPSTGRSPSPVRLLSLAPLRERDVRTAALAESMDAERFLVEIWERDAEGLAALPLTLRMMLAGAKDEAGLPQTQAGLYASGVRHLLGEPDPIRRKGEAPLRMEIGERLAVAERIGAAVLLSRRSGVSLLPGHASPGDVDPAEITGFDEPDRLAAGGDRFNVGENEVLETLRTALFSITGSERVAFSHRSLAEYCAGACLANAGLDRPGLASILFAAGDSEGRLIPQLREVAAWAAALDPVALEAVLESEAEVLLRIDRLSLDVAQRAQVVDAILNAESAERIGRWDRRVWRSMIVLDHPGLPAQLIPLIEDPDANWSVRRLAITLARVCERRECEPALLRLACDENQPAWVRDDGVWALREYGSTDSRRGLIPLALETIEDDVDDEIKGSALAALFPGLISVEQVFEALTAPRNTHLLGAYSVFLHRDLPEALQRVDLPVALKWAAAVPPTHRPSDELHSLADAVLGKAWPYIVGDDEIASLVADVVRPRLKAHVDLLNSIYRDEDRQTFRDAAGRHRLIEELIPDIGESGFHAAALAATSPDLLVPDDLSWVFTKLESALGTDAEAAWVQIARMAFALPIADSDLETLFRLCRQSEELDRGLGHWLSPVLIDSEQADSLREQYRHSRPRADDPPDRREEMDEAVESDLLAAEQGEVDGWWKLNYSLVFDEHGRSEPRVGELEADLTVLPGWARSSPELRARVTALARPALDLEPPEPEEWFARSIVNRAAFAGYRALHLIAKSDQAQFEVLPRGVWERWMPIIIDFPTNTLAEGERCHEVILARAAALADSSFAAWAEREIVAEMEKGEGHIFFLHRLEGIASPALTDRVIQMLADESLRASSLRDLLGFALKRDPERAFALAAPRLAVDNCDPDNDQTRESLVTLVTKLLALAPGLVWSEVAALFDRCPEIGKDVLLGLARDERTSLAGEMSDSQLAEFVAWIFGAFPESGDPPLQEGIVSPRESLSQYRHWLLESLAERGTDLAVDIIDGLHDDQGTPTLRFALRKAKDARRAKSPAPAPGDVIRMLRAGQLIPPRTSSDLLSRVLSALGSIQESLRAGQPPTASELWNTRPTNTPKDEGDLSNWLSTRLARELGEGFDVSRERLTSGGGRGRGKSVDLQVVCLANGSQSRRLQLLLEVKGSWESALESKMRTQLADGYMATTGIDHAIYLVFWFAKASWDESDSRRARSHFDSAEEARTVLAAQAGEVAAECGARIEAIVLDGSLR